MALRVGAAGHRSDGRGHLGDTVTIARKDPAPWVFPSEAQCFGSTSIVPEAGPLATRLAGLTLLGILARRRRRR